MYRDAIRNTWTVEEVDFSDDVVDLHRKLTAGRAAPDQPPGRVLRHRRLDRLQQPGAQPLQAHQRARGAAVPVAPALRGGAARPVLPDAARHLHPRPRRARRGVRAPSRTSRRSGARPSSASSGSTRSTTSTSCDTREDRRQFLLNLICFAACIEGLFFFGAFAYVYFLRSQGPAQRPGRRHQLGVPRRDRATWTSPSRSSTPCAREEPDLFDDELRRAGRAR